MKTTAYDEGESQKEKYFPISSPYGPGPCRENHCSGDDTLAKRFCSYQVKSGYRSGQIVLAGCSDNGSQLQKSQGLPECNRYLHNNFSKPFNYDYENAKAKMRYQQVKVRSPHRPELDTEQSRTRCAQVMVGSFFLPQYNGI